jgi:hypothetical protein
VAAAGGLFHNQSSFAPSNLQRTYLRWGVVNSLPSATQDISDHLEKKFLAVFDMVYEDTKIHRTLLRCKKVEQEINTFCVWEKHVGPLLLSRESADTI